MRLRVLWLPICGFALFGWFALFVLPWILPPKLPVPSMAFAFGFNNSIAVLGLAALLGIILLWRLQKASAIEEKCAALPLRLMSDELISHDRTALFVTIFVALVTSSCVWAWWCYLPWSYFGESRYFLPRLDSMYVGLVPYRDFEFGYGPVILYIPFALQGLIGRSLPLDSAYILTVILFEVLGFYLLYRVVCFLNVSTRTRILILIFVALAGFNLSLAAIYTPLRFIWAIFAVLLVYRMTECSARMATPAGNLRIGFAILTLCLGGFAVAPECGISTSLALSCYVVWLFFCVRRSYFPLILTPAAAVILVYVFFGNDYFKMVIAFGSGALHLPIPPAPYILLLVVAAAWILPIFAQEALAGPLERRARFVALTLCLGLGLPPALGRCDPGHVFWNGLPLFLVAGCAAWSSGQRWVRHAASAGAILLTLTVWISYWGHYSELFSEQIQARRNIQKAQSSLLSETKFITDSLDKGQLIHFPWSKVFFTNRDALELLKFGKIATPLGVTEDLDKFLKASNRYVPEYHIGPYDGVFLWTDFQRKLAAIDRASIIMIPRDALSNLSNVDHDASAQATSRFLTRLFVFPVNWKFLRLPIISDAIVVDYLNRNFRLKEEFHDCLLLERRHQ